MWWARASGNHGFRRSHGQEGAAHRSNRGLPASAPLARRLAHLQCWTTAQQRERTWGGVTHLRQRRGRLTAGYLRRGVTAGDHLRRAASLLRARRRDARRAAPSAWTVDAALSIDTGGLAQHWPGSAVPCLATRRHVRSCVALRPRGFVQWATQRLPAVLQMTVCFQLPHPRHPSLHALLGALRRVLV